MLKHQLLIKLCELLFLMFGQILFMQNLKKINLPQICN